MGKQRSRTTEPSAKPESGRALVLRRLRLFVVLALAAWGVVVSLALLAAMAQGHCGPDRTCGGRGYLMLGPWGIVAAILIDGMKSRQRRQTGPVVMVFIIEALLVGATLVFAWPVFFTEAPWPWRVFMGILALLGAGVTGWFVSLMLKTGLRESVRRQVWVQDIQKAENRRIYIYPQTRQERTNATVLLVHTVLGLCVGTALGFLYI
ncbi:hypothetical protein [Streptomyces sp. 4N124]|uniref:hypothetical protein n=1 Tax=Streptomyces sp. 4N124 TaxID=3457420 RepID=UPI003FD42D2B